MRDVTLQPLFFRAPREHGDEQRLRNNHSQGSHVAGGRQQTYFSRFQNIWTSRHWPFRRAGILQAVAVYNLS